MGSGAGVVEEEKMKRMMTVVSRQLWVVGVEQSGDREKPTTQ